jgi:hypothetical protein
MNNKEMGITDAMMAFGIIRGQKLAKKQRLY